MSLLRGKNKTKLRSTSEGRQPRGTGSLTDGDLTIGLLRNNIRQILVKSFLSFPRTFTIFSHFIQPVEQERKRALSHFMDKKLRL